MACHPEPPFTPEQEKRLREMMRGEIAVARQEAIARDERRLRKALGDAAHDRMMADVRAFFGDDRDCGVGAGAALAAGPVAAGLPPAPGASRSKAMISPRRLVVTGIGLLALTLTVQARAKPKADDAAFATIGATATQTLGPVAVGPGQQLILAFGPDGDSSEWRGRIEIGTSPDGGRTFSPYKWIDVTRRPDMHGSLPVDAVDRLRGPYFARATVTDGAASVLLFAQPGDQQ
jgi:hypothetical protein